MSLQPINDSIKENVGEVIGNTPMVYLNKIGAGLPARVAAKCEFMNPANSVKDRIGKAMIEDAEKKGLITPGKSTIVEPTSGNTGVALAMVCAAKGYKCILAMPSSLSLERRIVMRGFGAELRLSDPAKGVQGAIDICEDLLKEIPDSFMPMQFSNPSNPQVHFDTTGPEIWAQTGGKVDIMVGGVGTGGTITGAGRFLKSKKDSVQLYCVEPVESPVLSGGKPSPHKIQGIGAGIVPDNVDLSIMAGIEQVHSDEAIAMARRLAVEEGLFVGISCGAAVVAAMRLAAKEENKGKLITVVLPSFGERYLSTPLFEELRAECTAMTH